MKSLAQGRVLVWEGASLWILEVDPPPDGPQRTDFHAHHAIQVTLALQGGFELQAQDRAWPGPVAVVAPDVRHAFEPKGLIGLLFVEPESPAGLTLTRTLLADAPVASVPPGLMAGFVEELAEAYRSAGHDDASLAEIGRRMVRALAGDGEALMADERVQAILAWASRHLDRRLSIAEAAAQVGLSTDRMSHLFVEQTGLPFRTYLLWLRLTKGIQRYLEGASLTAAAHEAGFSDSAHFSRTFRRMFGVAAAELNLA
jgi:AraC-like DNA-binding protein